VLVQAGYKALHPEAPVAEPIGVVGMLALVANGSCLALLWRHRADDINMRSVAVLAQRHHCQPVRAGRRRGRLTFGSVRPDRRRTGTGGALLPIIDSGRARGRQRTAHVAPAPSAAELALDVSVATSKYEVGGS
jgi:hypothetical protein